MARKINFTKKTINDTGLALLATLLAVTIGGCAGSGPEAIHFGQDQCAYCLMTIVDKSFASELKTGTGKTYKFDSIECLAAYQLREKLESHEISGNWVSTVDRPGELVPLDSTVIVFSDNIRSPMGGGLSAHVTRESAQASIQANSGIECSWDQVLDLIKLRWSL